MGGAGPAVASSGLELLADEHSSNLDLGVLSGERASAGGQGVEPLMGCRGGHPVSHEGWISLVGVRR